MSDTLLPGTRRAVAPETTWARVEPLLPEYGITRVADVTRLDDIGIPVFIAIRPESETLAVSQGKGATPLLAKLSAVLESIELWHAERPAPRSFIELPSRLDLPYRLTDLNVRDTGLALEALPVQWLTARSLAGGAAVPVPLDVVRLSYSGEHFRRPRIFQTSSTGLASGNTFAEACLHALCEAIERDVLTTTSAGQYLDPAAVDDPHLIALLDRLRTAGAEFELVHLPNRFALPTFAARVWSPLFPVVCSGSGTHPDPCVALSRAITEAVQSRLTEITSTRDDIPSDFAMDAAATADPGFRSGTTPLAEVRNEYPEGFDGWDEELADVTTRIESTTGRPPLVVDLSTRPELFHVVKVVCPGLAYTNGRMLAA
ncbi:YcaO-like family protein [Amycolatopsis sp. NPDC026612]|uniref:YcaO-like family protein n=1 Tax=Amycolatopsis sp. NPDC026612 TaxID=3155466 RepID=UPI0033FD2F34